MDEKNKKIIFIPGWLHTVKFYGDYDGLDIWADDSDFDVTINVDCIIAYSLGTNFALLNWKKNPAKKLILVNPLVAKQNPLNWFWRWIKYYFGEGDVLDKNINKIKIFSGLRKAYQILNNDFVEIIKNIPNENIIIIRGQGDDYFCHQSFVPFLREQCDLFIEVENARHNWNESLKKEVDRLIKI